jgi:two-component system, NtrC family, nitrogen regulation response regulator NtrX
MAKILIIDDESSIREVLTEILEDEGYESLTAHDGIAGLQLLKTEIVDLVILDIWLPNKGGIDVLSEIKETYPDIEVIIISGHANIDMAVKAVKLGAFDFIEKPLSLDKVLTLVRNALTIEQLRRENKTLHDSMVQSEKIIGNSEEIRKIRYLIAQSASVDSRVLITGENGTGKELVAKAIHMGSSRARRPFIEVNCAAIPDTLIESELFGHEKGAFTSAVSQRRGKFESAHRGTIFLDEVADMSLSAQAKVLRVIQELRFERIGGEEQIEVDVRIISATNKDIQKEIKRGNFREDLFFRLNVIPIHLPPLRERLEDLPLLIDHFIKNNTKEGEPEKIITPNGMAVLKQYSWPGNIRELRNFIERILTMTTKTEVTEEDVHTYLGNQTLEEEKNPLGEFDEMGLNQAKDHFERKYIVQKLEKHEYNISRTAQELGIYPSNLHGKIKKFGIEIKR